MTRTRQLLVAVLVALACSACVPMGPGLAPFIPGPVGDSPVVRQVVVIGDSLSAEPEQQAKETWKTVPDVTVSYQAFGGTQHQHWMDRFAEVPEGAILLDLLGTNDAVNLPLDQAIANMRAALDVVATRHPACVVWFRMNTTSARLRPAADREKVLAFIRAATAIVESGDYPWLVMQRWDLTSAGRTDWLKLPDDVVHHTPAGSAAYIAEQVEALNRCPSPAPEPAPTTTTTVTPTTLTPITLLP